MSSAEITARKHRPCKKVIMQFHSQGLSANFIDDGVRFIEAQMPDSYQCNDNIETPSTTTKVNGIHPYPGFTQTTQQDDVAAPLPMGHPSYSFPAASVPSPHVPPHAEQMFSPLKQPE